MRSYKLGQEIKITEAIKFNGHLYNKLDDLQ